MGEEILIKTCGTCGKEVHKPKKYSKTQWADFRRCSKECLRLAKIKHDKKVKIPKLRIAFVWQGISDEKIRGKWKDGLQYAMKKISKSCVVHYFEPWQDINGYDVILYWEAPVTAQGQNAPHYNKVRQNPTKKALLFAGGPIKKEWVSGFDLLFLESKINERECDDLGIQWHHAFGINTTEFTVNNRSMDASKKRYDGMLHGTCASWKRQWLIGEAFGSRGCVIGRGQDSDPYPFNRCRELGCDVFPESGPGVIRSLMQESVTLVNCCDYWGGGQRATLEAMSVGLPVICCNDSPKNMEFIEGSGFGRVASPDIHSIRQAVEDLKQNPPDWRIGVKYVRENWSGDVYARQLMEGIKKII
jgi:glycosyltransferase involved in cell wall biosynthesis